MLLDRRVDGMIFISCEMTDLRARPRHYARLLGEGARIVFVNGALERARRPVGRRRRARGRQLATQHLLDLGHERIGFVAGPTHYRPTREKAAGRESALRAAGLEPDGLVAHAEFGVEGGRRRSARLARRPGAARPA